MAMMDLWRKTVGSRLQPVAPPAKALPLSKLLMGLYPVKAEEPVTAAVVVAVADPRKGTALTTLGQVPEETAEPPEKPETVRTAFF